jgi:hypothetical protein
MNYNSPTPPPVSAVRTAGGPQDDQLNGPNVMAYSYRLLVGVTTESANGTVVVQNSSPAVTWTGSTLPAVMSWLASFDTNMVPYNSLLFVQLSTWKNARVRIKAVVAFGSSSAALAGDIEVDDEPAADELLDSQRHNTQPNSAGGGSVRSDCWVAPDVSYGSIQQIYVADLPDHQSVAAAVRRSSGRMAVAGTSLGSMLDSKPLWGTNPAVAPDGFVNAQFW